MEECIFHPLQQEGTFGGFTNPFRHVPHRMVIRAAQEVAGTIGGTDSLAEIFREGKMIGVLIVRDMSGRTGYLAGFSGNAGGDSVIKGFVPPIYDLNAQECKYRKEEAEIVAIGERIKELEESPELKHLRKEADSLRIRMQEEISRAQAAAKLAKLEREAIRSGTCEESMLSELIRQSQFSKAEIKRLKDKWKAEIENAENKLSALLEQIRMLKSMRSAMSDRLQKWIFSQYIVHNAIGEESSIGDLFSRQGLVPPGGTGECAAPKLLEYAYGNSLTPLAMGEFWYGESPDTAVRTHGHFYPSCTSKCGPLLDFMLRGLPVQKGPECMEEKICGEPVIIYEDNEIIIADKPSGMPSVPGLDGKTSLQEWLSEHFPQESGKAEVYSVHRLDMDTSGIMIFARSPLAASHLMKQFEERSIRKTYIARLNAPDIPGHTFHGNETKGRIVIPLSPDHDERPRQRADKQNGKESVTEFEVISVNPDGSADVIFRPLTGRTHQLRVHSAHASGLSRPITGDILYGGYSIYSSKPVSRLCLHALSITFTHPADGKQMTFASSANSYAQENPAKPL